MLHQDRGGATMRDLRNKVRFILHPLAPAGTLPVVHNMTGFKRLGAELTHVIKVGERISNIFCNTQKQFWQTTGLPCVINVTKYDTVSKTLLARSLWPLAQ